MDGMLLDDELLCEAEGMLLEEELELCDDDGMLLEELLELDEGDGMEGELLDELLELDGMDGMLLDDELWLDWQAARASASELASNRRVKFGVSDLIRLMFSILGRCLTYCKWSDMSHLPENTAF